jgi:hypothetical protein
MFPRAQIVFAVFFDRSSSGFRGFAQPVLLSTIQILEQNVDSASIPDGILATSDPIA